MRNLLRANFYRLGRDRTFRMCAAAVLALSVVFMLGGCREAVQEAADYGAVTELDGLYFQIVPTLGIFISILVCLFLGVEYGEGTVRNKLSMGHTRRDVYLANFLTVAAASLALQLMWMAGACVGIPFLGTWTLRPDALALLFLLVAGTSVAMAAIFTCIEMLHTGRSSSIVTLLSYFAMLFAASAVYNILSEPEFYAGTIVTVDGVQVVEPEPNPLYVTGALRAFYEFVMDFLPTGQIARIQNMDMGHPLRMLLSSAFITASVTFGGAKLFARTDLK